MKLNKIFIITMIIVLQFASILAAEEIEYLNDQVLTFANEHKGEKIGKGECWDLAAKPLNGLDALWDGKFTFGKKIGGGDSSGLKMESGMTILPGDIIQFTRVQASWTKGLIYHTETIGRPYHTAIIGNYDGKSLLLLLHQNVQGKRYVIETTLNLSDIKSGMYIIYRPFRVKVSSMVSEP